MGLSVDAYSQNYANQVNGYSSPQAAENTKAAGEKTVEESGATVEFSSAGKQALEESKEAEKASEDKVVKQTAAEKIASKTNKMSESDRAALVKQLQADADSRQNQLLSMVQKMFTNQANTFGKANSTDMWRFLASGKFTVDAATKAQAQKDISEDGYYGVKQTSERMFEFAMALSGGDVDKMEELQKAVEKGYKQAEKTWGGNLPDISKQTLDATNKLFEDYYESQKKVADTNPVQASEKAMTE